MFRCLPIFRTVKSLSAWTNETELSILVALSTSLGILLTFSGSQHTKWQKKRTDTATDYNDQKSPDLCTYIKVGLANI